MPSEKSVLSGNTAMLLLKLLSEKDMYGYEMIDTLRKRSENVFELKAGTLYPLLHGLEERRFLVSYEKEAGGKLRKYYSLTSEGKKYFEQKLAEWHTYANAVTNVLAIVQTNPAEAVLRHLIGPSGTDTVYYGENVPLFQNRPEYSDTRGMLSEA